MFIKCFINQKQCKLENKLCNRKNGGMLIIPALPSAQRKNPGPRMSSAIHCSLLSVEKVSPFTF